jgi:hypothetical protein
MEKLTPEVLKELIEYALRHNVTLTVVDNSIELQKPVSEKIVQSIFIPSRLLKNKSEILTLVKNQINVLDGVEILALDSIHYSIEIYTHLGTHGIWQNIEYLRNKYATQEEAEKEIEEQLKVASHPKYPPSYRIVKHVAQHTVVKTYPKAK